MSAPASPDMPSPESERHQEALRQFVTLWGEMASHWGINRTMAQIHALLYASEHPLDTDEIMARLDISRGNANMNLRSLVDWNLVEKTNRPGSRKDYYLAEKDVWRITTTIIEERRRREIEPVRQRLTGSAATLRTGGALAKSEQAFAERIENLIRLLEVFDGFTGALLPFLSDRQAGEIKEVIRFARKLRREQKAARKRAKADG